MLKIRKVQVVLTGSGAGFGDTVPLPELRRRGRIMRVMVREDSALNEMDSGLVTIWEDRHPVADTMPFERRVYASALQFWLGSDTVAELDQNLADTGGVAYDCEDVMQAALYAKTALGVGASTRCVLTVWAIVEH